MNIQTRFFAKVNKNGPIAPDMDTPCWLWTGATTDGYGRFWADGRAVIAHKWYWEQQHGLVPDGLELDHVCQTRACVLHTEAATHQKNVQRSRITGWQTRNEYNWIDEQMPSCHQRPFNNLVLPTEPLGALQGRKSQ